MDSSEQSGSERPKILSETKQDSTARITIQSKQLYIIDIGENVTSTSPRSYNDTVFKNTLTVVSYLQNSPVFSHELLVYHVLSAVGLEDVSITVRIFEPVDNHDLLQAVLLACNRLKNCSFLLESDGTHLRISTGGSLLCHTPVLS